MTARSRVVWLGACVLLLTVLAFAYLWRTSRRSVPSANAKVTSGQRQSSLASADNQFKRSTLNPIPCSAIRNLRELGHELTFFTNARTGDELEYIVIGDATLSNDVIVMFPGTGQTLADWPVQMLTNAQQSPKIVDTLAYSRSEDGAVSLCHNYRILLFDLPGVGKSRLHGSVTANQKADDVEAMIDDAARTYGISISQVDLVGWSLGTVDELKYALLAPKADPAQAIRSVVLIATKPGGNTDGIVDGNQAQCVSTVLNALKSASSGDRLLALQLARYAFELIFPYQNQQPYDGLDSGCIATVNHGNGEVKLNVDTACAFRAECRKSIADEVLNQRAWPWALTGGVPPELYVQQRQENLDYSVCYCGAANSRFQTSDCHCSRKPEMSEANGALCQTTSKPPNKPVSTDCAPLTISGTMTVINGPEDLYIQHTYGRALVDAYQQELGTGKVKLVTYLGADGAGHGILLQHPKWTQAQIWNALNPGQVEH
jgi:pimeloyl-ACP methyl ester carboxylesterase